MYVCTLHTCLVPKVVSNMGVLGTKLGSPGRAATAFTMFAVYSFFLCTALNLLLDPASRRETITRSSPKI